MGLLIPYIILLLALIIPIVIVLDLVFFLGGLSIKKEYENKLDILRRYHGGDGTVTISDVAKALRKQLD